MKTSINRLHQFKQAADIIAAKHPKAEKLIEAISLLEPSVTPFFKEFETMVKKIKLKHANTDANGSLLFLPDKSGFAYTKDAYELLEEEVDALTHENRFEYEPVYVNAPENFPSELLPFLKGFIIE